MKQRSVSVAANILTIVSADKMYIPAEFMEKFAELIVKECLRIVRSNIYGPAGEYDYSYTEENYAADGRAESILEDIKDHFGVEE